jgi:uncharacterized damage-inducible protein DinB
MNVAEVLVELYGRIPPLARNALADVDPDRLTEAPTQESNTIAWLIWHLIRIQDHHVAELLETDQIWDAEWSARFGLDPDPNNTGYGHHPDDVATVQPDGPNALLEYLDAVESRTQTLLEGLTPSDLDRVVDRRWDPPVTLGVRLVSIADDSLQHVGQAAYLRGLLGY